MPAPRPALNDRHLAVANQRDPLPGINQLSLEWAGLPGPKLWRFRFNMAEGSSSQTGGPCEKPEGSSLEPAAPSPDISRVKLLDTMVDTFLQKLVAAGR